MTAGPTRNCSRRTTDRFRGQTPGCYIRDAFCRGILAADSPDVVIMDNTVIRCPVQQSKDFRMQGN